MYESLSACFSFLKHCVTSKMMVHWPVKLIDPNVMPLNKNDFNVTSVVLINLKVSSKILLLLRYVHALCSAASTSNCLRRIYFMHAHAIKGMSV